MWSSSLTTCTIIVARWLRHSSLSSSTLYVHVSSYHLMKHLCKHLVGILGCQKASLSVLKRLICRRTRNRKQGESSSDTHARTRANKNLTKVKIRCVNLRWQMDYFYSHRVRLCVRSAWSGLALAQRLRTQPRLHMWWLHRHRPETTNPH